MEDDIKIDTPVAEPQKEEVVIDYERINKTINSKVEAEVGKFIKSFIADNRENKITTNEINAETQEERELKQWKI